MKCVFSQNLFLVRVTFMFCSSHFSFLVFGHFSFYENMKILRNLCVDFSRQDGQDGNKRKENQATKVTKIPKDENVG